MVRKVFEKLEKNKIADHLEKCGLFSDFQYGCRSSPLTAGLLTVTSDRAFIRSGTTSSARAFIRSGTTSTVALDISKAFDMVGMLAFFTILSLMEFHQFYQL